MLQNKRFLCLLRLLLSHRGDGEAARHDARNRAPLQAAAAFAVNLTRQAKAGGSNTSSHSDATSANAATT
jgi:hypothetical protein